MVAHRAGAGVTPRAQAGGDSRAGQRAGGQGGLGPSGVGDPDHRGTVVAILVVIPSIGLLFALVQRNLVEEESQPVRQPPADAGGTP